MKAFEYSFRVHWGDTDGAGIVFFPNYYKWMDEAIHEYFRSIGSPISQLITKEKIGLPTVEASCRFQKPLFYDEDVLLKTTIVELREKVVRFHHEFFQGEEIVAKGYQVRAFVQMGEKLKGIPIPENIKEAMKNSGIIHVENE